MSHLAHNCFVAEVITESYANKDVLLLVILLLLLLFLQS